MHSTPVPGGRRAVTAALTAVVLALGLSGCTGDDDNDDGPSRPAPASSTATGTAEVPLHVEVTRVAGHLPPAQRKRLARQLSRPINRYVEAAFLSAERVGVSGFTRGTAARARKDRPEITAARWAEPGTVEARKLNAYVSVLAPHRRPAGATARIHFVFRAGEQRLTLKGRLLLTPRKGGWQIFGYDLARSTGTAGDK